MARVFIDPGHGGADNGAAYGFYEEDDDNLAVAQLLEYELRLQGVTTEMSGRQDVEVSLADRVAKAKEFKADAFVSIHCDAWHQQTVHGYSTHIYLEGDRLLGGHIHRRLQEALTGHSDRGLKESNFYVLRNTARISMPSALVECEFISNPETAAFLKEPENQKKIAIAIAAGILAFLSH
jgi:N-acetylmuramoyl-L-alanine amidase